MKEKPYFIDVKVEFDPLHTDPLLQHSLLYPDSTHDTTAAAATTTCKEGKKGMTLGGLAHKRKLSLVDSSSSSLSSSSSSSDVSAWFCSCSSDTSGRFDDADELDYEVEMADCGVNDGATATATATATGTDKDETRSAHSAKRGRSNGWPLTDEIAYDENGMRMKKPATARAAALSPTTTRTTPCPCPHDNEKQEQEKQQQRVRQSRFIEGSMNDRVSQKPPSIFLQDEQDHHHQIGESNNNKNQQDRTVEKRSSGIFRFGKAIASAFHPFTWNSSSSSNKSDALDTTSGNAAKSQKEIMKQRQARAEKAYAELKKTGFKGTTQTQTINNTVDAHIADQTWKAIQDKMEYSSNSNKTQPKRIDGRVSQDETREQAPKSASKFKSFADLRKRTSTLSIPSMMRVRDVSSPVSVPVPVPSGANTNAGAGPGGVHLAVPERDDAEQNKRLGLELGLERRQSKKELNRQAKLMKRVSNLEDKLLRARRELRELASVEQQQQQPQLQTQQVPAICVDDVHNTRPALPTVPSQRVLEEQEEALQQQQEKPLPKTPAQWPPVDSLSRKRKSVPVASIESEPATAAAATATATDPIYVNDTDTDMEDYDADCGKPRNDSSTPKKAKSKPKSSSNGSNNKLKTNRDKRASSLTTKASQRLKAKQSSRNLRQLSNNNNDSNNECKNTGEEKPQLQQQDGNTSRSPAISASVPASVFASAQLKEKREFCDADDDENIPPVPPLPKELLQSVKKAGSKRFPSREFAWPEGIF